MSGKLEFSEEDHKYTVDGKELTSVTTFIHEFFPKFDEEKKSKEVAERTGRSQEEVLAEWKASADHGTEVHNEVEAYIKEGLKPISSKARMARFWCHNNSWDDNLQSELRIFSEELGLAGTIDLVIEHSDGSVSLADWKTNKKIYRTCFGRGGNKPETAHLADCNYNQYNLQLSLYAYLLEEYYGKKIRGLYLVHLKDGEYVEYKLDYLRELIKEMVESER